MYEPLYIYVCKNVFTSRWNYRCELCTKYFIHWFITACTEDNPCEGLGRHASFKHFFIAFLTLFRIATGDNWNGIMKVRVRMSEILIPHSKVSSLCNSPKETVIIKTPFEYSQANGS